MVSGITSATHISESILAEGPRRIVAAVDTEEVDYYYASRALTRITAPSPSREEKRCFVISDLPFSYFGFIAASAGTFGLSKAGAARGWLIFGGVGIALGFAASYFDLWDRFKPKSSDKLWGEYKSAETLEERLELIENLRNKGDDDAVKNLRFILTQPGASKKEIEAAEEVLEFILKKIKIWETFEKSDNLDVQEGILKTASAFPTRGNVIRFLKLPSSLDKVIISGGRTISLKDRYLEWMGEYNPVGVVETIIDFGDPERAQTILENLQTLPDTRFPSSHSHYLSGCVAEENNETGVAIEEYEKAVSMDATFFPPHFRLGIIYARLGFDKEALAKLKQAIELAGDHASLFFDRIFSTVLMGQQGDMALLFLDKIDWKQFATPFQTERYQGIQRHLQGKYAEAIESYKKALQINPSHFRTRFSLALAYRNLETEEGRLRAREIFSELQNEMPSVVADPETRDLYAAVFHELGIINIAENSPEADRFFQMAIQEYPSNSGKARAYTDLGVLYQTRLKMPQKALEFYDKALALSSYGLARLNRTSVLRKLGREEEAVEELLRLTKEPKIPSRQKSDAYSRLADIALGEKDWEAALAYATSAVDEYPESVYGRWNIAEAYEGMGQSVLALDAYEKALKYRQKSPENLFSEISELIGHIQRLREPQKETK